MKCNGLGRAAPFLRAFSKKPLAERASSPLLSASTAWARHAATAARAIWAVTPATTATTGCGGGGSRGRGRPIRDDNGANDKDEEEDGEGK